jgi:hypothetical protein
MPGPSSSKVSLGAVLLLVLHPLASSAADPAWTAGGGSGPTPSGTCAVEYDEGRASVAWSECEGISAGGLRSGLYSSCEQLNSFLEAEISCRYDKPSFEAHYSQLAKEKAEVRRSGGAPDSTCAVAIGCFSDYSAAVGSIVSSYLKEGKDQKALKEFQGRIKLVTCKYIDGKDKKVEKSQSVEPFVEVKGSELILHVRTDLYVGARSDLRTDASGVGHGCDWIKEGVLSNFKALKKVVDDHR